MWTPAVKLWPTLVWKQPMYADSADSQRSDTDVYGLPLTTNRGQPHRRGILYHIWLTYPTHYDMYSHTHAHTQTNSNPGPVVHLSSSSVNIQVSFIHILNASVVLNYRYQSTQVKATKWKHGSAEIEWQLAPLGNSDGYSTQLSNADLGT